jgi:hypothetical protein
MMLAVGRTWVDALLGLELVVVLGVTVLACGFLARQFRVAPPVLLLACGALLGLAPALRGVHLPPEVVLLLFLPALLYWESLTISHAWRCPGECARRFPQVVPGSSVQDHDSRHRAKGSAATLTGV